MQDTGSSHGTIRELIVVDLEASRLARPLVSRAAAAAIRAGGAGVGVLVADEATGLPTSSLATTFRSGDVLTDAVVRDAQRWTDAMARDLALGTGRDLFPVRHGIHFGELTLLDIQHILADFAMFAGSMVSLLERNPVERVRIFAADSERAKALAGLARTYCPATTAWSSATFGVVRNLTSVLTATHRVRASLRRRQEPPPAARIAIPAARVLTISETLPMAQMFAAVEARLEARGVGPVTRVQFGSAAGITAAGNTTVAALGRTSAVPAQHTGRFARHWHSVARRVGRLELSAPFARGRLRAPVSTLMQYLHGPHFDQLFEQLELAHRILDEARPDLLVVGNDRWWVELVFVLVARQRGIPSLLLQDGVTCDYAVWWWATADRVAAWGEDWAGQLTRHGLEPERVTITGQPRYDPFAAGRSPTQRVTARQSMGLRDDDFAILLATQPVHTPALIREAVEALLTVAGARVILRPKPGVRDLVSEELRSRHGDRVLVCAKPPITTLLDACDVVVTEYSTVGLEAAILGIPLVTFTFTGRPTPLSYAEFGLATNALDAAELVAAVEHVRVAPAEHSAQQSAVEHLCGPVDGRASERVAALVEEMLQRAGR